MKNKALKVASAALLPTTLIFGQFDATIPVLDMNDFYKEETREIFVEDLRNACKETGFFALLGTGVDAELLDEAYDSAKEFFSYDFDRKMTCTKVGNNGQRGYVPGETAKGQELIDFKEFYHVGRDVPPEELKKLSNEVNVWPEFMDLETPLNTLFAALEKHRAPLEQAFALAIGVPVEMISHITEGGNTLLRAIHYPAQPPKNQFWAAAHTDINLFTLLPRATSDGLQIYNKEGEWIDVKVPQGAFVINCGDMLENLTNGEFRSARHRVVSNGEGHERYSMVMFVHGKSDDAVSPINVCIDRTGGEQRFADATVRELLMERLADLGLASEGMLKELADSGIMHRLIDAGRASQDAMVALKKAGFASEQILDELEKNQL